MSYTVNIYNFSGATSKPISIAWLVGNTGSDGTPTSTYAPTDNVTPFQITVPNVSNFYNFWYYQTDNGSYISLTFNTSGEANIYLLNDPGIVTQWTLISIL